MCEKLCHLRDAVKIRHYYNYMKNMLIIALYITNYVIFLDELD